MNLTQIGNRQARKVRAMLMIFIIFTLALTALLCYQTYILPEETEGRFFTITMRMTYENGNEKDEIWNFTEDDMTVGLFMNNTWQTVYLADSSHAVKEFKIDLDGNALAAMDFPTEIGSGRNFSYEVTYKIILKQHLIPDISEDRDGALDNITEELKNSYCKTAGPWQISNPSLKEQAYKIVGNETKVLTIVKRFIVWIKENIRYGSLEVPRYPNETFSEGVGDCDDQANLLITFCRMVGIPAYLQIGCIYMPQRQDELSTYWSGHLLNNLSKIGWHGWAVVYIPPWGWLPVDLTYVRGDLRVSPLNAIETSAIIMDPTVQYLNITRTDYVADSRNFRDFIIAHNFYICEYDAMSEESVEELNSMGFLDLQPKLTFFVHITGITLFLAGKARVVEKCEQR